MTINKALVAFIGSLVFFFQQTIGIELNIGEGWVAGLALVLTPLLTWLIPNAPRSERKSDQHERGER